MMKMICFFIWENVFGVVVYNENNVLCDFICYKDNFMMGDDFLYSFFYLKYYWKWVIIFFLVLRNNMENVLLMML